MCHKSRKWERLVLRKKKKKKIQISVCVLEMGTLQSAVPREQPLSLSRDGVQKSPDGKLPHCSAGSKQSKPQEDSLHPKNTQRKHGGTSPCNLSIDRLSINDSFKTQKPKIED